MYFSAGTPKKEVTEFLKKVNQNKEGVKYEAKIVKTPLGKMYKISKK
jgi:hypothetical protein